LDAQFSTALAGGSAKYVSVINTLCDRQGCITRDEKGDPIQHDYGHFTRSGARLVARMAFSSNTLASLASFPEK
jgi:hypothetical protein